MKNKSVKTIIMGFFLGMSLVATAQLPANIEKVTSVEGITEYRLKNNGLKVLVFPDPSKQTMTVNITYQVGSRHEGYGETGMAHLLEHLVFKGSPKHKDIPGEFKTRGARFNGTTWVDRTNYFETFTASDENLEWALDLESDRMINSFIAKKDLETEFSVVRNEFEMGENDPSGVLMERVMSTAFLWHNYGKSTIGNRADIENVPIENLQAFYKKFYQPDNAVLLVAGKIDEAKALKMIDKYFSGIAKPSRVLPTTWSTEPTQDGERNVILKRVGDVQVTSAGYHIPAGSHSDFPAVQCFVDAITDNPSGRLYKNLVGANKATSIWGYAMQTHDPGFVYFNSDVRKEQSLDSAKMILTKTLDEVAKNPLNEEEVSRAKTQNLKQLEQLFRNTEQTGYLLSEFIAIGDWRLFFILRDNLEKVTAKDVDRVVKAYFKPSNRTVGLFVPEAKPDRAEIPATPEVSALVEGYKGRAQMAEGEVFDPSVSNIESRTKSGTAGSTKYAFLKKTTRGGTVSANMTLRFGDVKSLENKRLVAQMTANMLQKGTTKHTEQQIKDLFDGLKATVRVSGGQDNVNVSIETVKENLPKVLELVNEILREPAFPEKEFEEMRQQDLAQSEQQLSDPQALAGLAMDRHMNPYPKTDVRYTPTLEEDMAETKAIKVDDVKKFYKEFYGGSNSTVAIVGDFDEEAAKKLITEGVGTWKSPKPYARLMKKHTDVPSKNDAIKTPDKANAMFFASLNLPLADTDADFAATYIGNYVLGGGALSNRLATRIRQKEGISYGVGSQLSADAQDKTGSFLTYAIYAPENAEKLEKAFKDEVEKILKDGITAEELEIAKKGITQSRMTDRATDRSLVGRLNRYQGFNRSLKWDAEFEAAIMKLSVADVNAALKKYINLSKMSMFKAGDFDKVVKKP
jgi:zinc protease